MVQFCSHGSPTVGAVIRQVYFAGSCLTPFVCLSLIGPALPAINHTGSGRFQCNRNLGRKCL